MAHFLENDKLQKMFKTFCFDLLKFRSSMLDNFIKNLEKLWKLLKLLK